MHETLSECALQVYEVSWIYLQGFQAIEQTRFCDGQTDRRTDTMGKTICLQTLPGGRHNLFSYSSTKTYVVGTQKNRLNETVLLSIKTTSLNQWRRKHSHFYAQKRRFTGPMQLVFVFFDVVYRIHQSY